MINCNTPNPLESSILNLTGLKYLLINFSLKSDECEILNKFTNLEQLFLYYISNRELRLDKLKVLVFRNTNRDRLRIDCPKLHTLKCYDLSQVEIKHPQTLNYISTLSFNDVILNFKNLKGIGVGEVYEKENILQQLPHLKFFNIYATHLIGLDRFPQTVQNARNLLNEKQILKRDVKIRFRYQEITNVQQLAQFFDNDDPYAEHRGELFGCRDLYTDDYYS